MDGRHMELLLDTSHSQKRSVFGECGLGTSPQAANIPRQAKAPVAKGTLS